MEHKWANLTPGEVIRELRKLKGWSQSELVKQLNCTIDKRAIDRLENNYTSLSLDRAEKLATALGVHPAVIAFPNWPLYREIDDSEVESDPEPLL